MANWGRDSKKRQETMPLDYSRFPYICKPFLRPKVVICPRSPRTGSYDI